MTAIRLATLLALASLLACGSKVQRRYVDPSFDAAALRDGGIVVGGVVVAEDNPELEPVELSLGRLLEESLRAEALPVTPRTAVAGALTASQLVALLDRYRSVGTLTPEHLRPLMGLAPRFVAFARIEGGDLDREITDNRAVTLGEDAVTESVTYATRRTVVSTFDVFDARSGTLMWTARFERTRGRRRSREHTVLDTSTGLAEEVPGAYGGDTGFPDAPELLELCEDVFLEFAAELP